MSQCKRFDFGGTEENPTIRDTVTGIEYPSEGYSLLALVNDLFFINERFWNLARDYNMSMQDIPKAFEDLLNENMVLKNSGNKIIADYKNVIADLKIVLPLLLALDFKISINECEAINRLCSLVDDEFIKGLDCDV